MAFNGNLFNATVVGENPDAAFLVENGKLHAVEQHVADLKKEKSADKAVLPLMRDALNALVKFAEGRVPPHFLEVISLEANEREQLMEKIVAIYQHLSHHDRHELSTLIHKQAV